MEQVSYHHKAVCRQVFRAYDIRGIIGEQLDADSFYSVAKAISCRMHDLKRRRIFVARDGRLTSEVLSKALTSGLLGSGIDVLDLGEVPTPIMYYATHAFDVDCGLMVTGSHNPADYNGIKMILAGTTLANKDIDALYELNQSLAAIKGQGEYQTLDLIPDYKARIVQDIQLQRSFKVVVDCGNGIAGPIAPDVLKALGCEVIPLYCDVDGHFPNHHPDPTVETNLDDLKAAIMSHQADLGIAFDGDADRLGLMTNTGELIWPDRLMMVYARDVLSRNPGAAIVYDVKCSSSLAHIIEQSGGRAVMCPTGHSLVKAVMKQEQAALAGEMSGHLFFKDRWYGFDDAIYSACRLLEILSQSLHTVHDQFSLVPNRLSTPEIKIPLADELKFDFMKRFSQKARFEHGRLITIDGVRVEFINGWGLIRASNTTPCLVARFEANDKDSLCQIQALFKEQLHALDDTLPISF